MADPFGPEDLEEGQYPNFDVEPERAMYQVVLVVLDLYRNRQLVPSADLRPAGKSRR